ncbi:MAG TPA: ABC transporter ATP-binding protein [Rectinemataceae bacterium]
MIAFEGISKTYAKSAKKAVDSIRLCVPDGKVFGFLGPNGAGKTTTLRLACGSLSPDSGAVFVDGIPMETRPLEAKSRIGLVQDNPELFNKLKAHEYLDFVADVFRVSPADRRARIAEFSERFSISDVLGSSIGSMSRGMKQKLCIVASLLHDPWNWILDEPMVGLDPEAAFQLKAIMRERASAGKCVFFSTHVMEVAEKVCDELAIIVAGRIAFMGDLAGLKALRGEDASLESLFLDLVEGEEG